MAIIDRIKYDGTPDGSPWLLYKYPSESFVVGSQLIVNQGQEALFFKGGEALDLFGAGTHTLQTGNLPILKKLVNLPFGGKTPFSAEIYYVNKTSRLDLRWGTAEPIPLEDPKYGMLLSIRSHGTYGIRINDTRQLVTEIYGAIPNGNTGDFAPIHAYFSGMLTNRIKTVLSSFMMGKNISFLEITPYLKELSEACRIEICEEFERFGIEIVNFYIETISPPKEEYAKLREYKEELSLGNDFYRQRRSFDILDSLASNNSAGSMANAGAGIGMGLGLMQNAGGLFSTMGQNVNIAPAQSSRTADEGVTCPQCGAKNAKDRKFCGECGQKLITGIACPSCGHVNPAGTKFCGECGTKLNRKCPACGYENDMSQKFCGECGTKL